jgi:SAM-dependent methyltransferase
MPRQTAAQVREHYEIEKDIALRLRNSSAAERTTLYKEAYDELYERVPHHPLLLEDPQSERRARVDKEVATLRPLINENSVFLEIGPGDCSVSTAIAGIAKRSYAADVTFEAVAGREMPENFEMLLFDGRRIPLPAESVDLAYSNQLMEHLHPDDAVEQLRSIFATLKPGGKYYCVTPNRLSGPHDVSRGFDAVATGLHLREYTHGELGDLFRSAGFRRTRVYLRVFGTNISLPVLPFRYIEALVSSLPERLRRMATYNRVGRFLLGVKLLAEK